MRRISLLAILLSLAGVVPLLFCGLAGLTAHRTWAIPALIAYGAVVLSFGGAVHWGFALAGSSGDSGPEVQRARLVLATIPALIGWAALLLPLWGGLVALIAGFVATLLGEVIAHQRDLLPRRYMALRWVLSVVAIAMVTTDLVLFLLGATVML